MRDIEKELSRYTSKIIDHATLASILTNLGYKQINDKIVWLKKQGILTPLKSGLYIYNSTSKEQSISKEIIANTLLGPSYISFDYALWYYSLIPESVYEVTSATTKRSKIFSTSFGTFSYRQIKKKLFSLGLNIKSIKSGNFIIASKEKALCDKVYYAKDISIRSKKAMADFLEDDLRIDMGELLECDMKVFQAYFHITKSKKIGLLQKIIEDTQE